MSRDRTEHEVAASRMSDDPRSVHERADVDDGCENRVREHAAQLVRVVDAVLETDDRSVTTHVRCERARRRFGVRRLDAHEHDVGVARCIDLRRSANLDGFAPVRPLDDEAALQDRVDVLRAPDQCHGRAGAREHSAEIAADGAGAEDGDARP